jgi:hypothetical protein
VTSRSTYIGAAATTIVVGLTVRFAAPALPLWVRDASGDALWAMMMYWWISVVWPRAGVVFRAGLAVIVSWTVEVSQLVHAPVLDAVRETLLGRLVLGSGFDTRDLVAYAVGVLASVAIERAARRRRQVV